VALFRKNKGGSDVIVSKLILVMFCHFPCRDGAVEGDDGCAIM